MSILILPSPQCFFFGNHNFGFKIFVFVYVLWIRFFFVSFLEYNKILAFNCGVIKLSWIIARKFRKSWITFSFKIVLAWQSILVWCVGVCVCGRGGPLNILFHFLLAHTIFFIKSVFILTFFCVFGTFSLGLLNF